MENFKNENERFKTYYEEICKTVLDITMNIVEEQADVTVVNILELLIQLERIEDKATRVKVLKAFKKGFMEHKFKMTKDLKDEEEEKKQENKEERSIN